MRLRYKNTCKLLTLIAMLVLATACNESSDSEPYSDSATLAVNGFSLKYDPTNLGVDSVYFAIDLNHAVIYNADSLRPGAKIDKLIPVINYSSDLDSVNITMTGGTTRTGVVDYKKNSTDSIDFSGRVTLTLVSGDKRRNYDVKVNVHKEYADSLRWDEASVTTLPSRLGSPLHQKTVALADTTAVSLIEEKDGTYTVSTSRDLYGNVWNKRAITIPFTPRVETLASSGDNLYILADDNQLYVTDLDGNWTATGRYWTEILGGYVNSVIGLEEREGALCFAQYPQHDINVTEIPEDFPVHGASNLVTLQNKWTLSPVAFMAGGVKKDGTLSSSTWAFDGSEWIRLNDADLPAMQQPSIIPYYSYRPTASGSMMEEFKVWMLVGGRQTDNTINRTVYLSYDNGVNWRKSSSLLQLPQVMPDMWGCDNIVADRPMQSNISNNWSTRYRRSGTGQTRVPYEVDGDLLLWNCPYIYLIGGQDAEGRICDTIWRGVLSRLTFAPII